MAHPATVRDGLLMAGEKSTDPAKATVAAVAAALPGVRLLVLDCHHHVADILDPGTFATHLLEFLQSDAQPVDGGLSG